MSAQAQRPQYSSYKAFYEANYGQSIVDARSLGAVDATMMSLKQGPGDWSDAPVPELVFTFLKDKAARASLDLGAGKFQLSAMPGSGVVIAPNVPTSIYVHGPHELIALGVPYRGLTDLMPGLIPMDGDFGKVHAEEVTDPLIFMLLTRLWDEGDNGSSHGRLFTEAVFTALMVSLLRLSSLEAKQPQVRGGLASWQVRRVVEHLRGLLGQDISLSELSSEVGLSPFHFARAFKSSLGVPPYRYQMRLRIEQACEPLASTNLPITEIALRVGYQSSQALARVFARELGTTPSAWRREKSGS